MKNKKSRTLNPIRKGFVLAILGTLFLVCNALGQSLPNEKLAPKLSKDEFKPTDGLITLNVKGRNKNIYSDTVRIYNEDGSLWYEFSFYESSPSLLQK